MSESVLLEVVRKEVSPISFVISVVNGHVFFKWSKSHFVCHLEFCGCNILAHSSK